MNGDGVVVAAVPRNVKITEISVLGYPHRLEIPAVDHEQTLVLSDNSATAAYNAAPAVALEPGRIEGIIEKTRMLMALPYRVRRWRFWILIKAGCGGRERRRVHKAIRAEAFRKRAQRLQRAREQASVARAGGRSYRNTYGNAHNRT